MKFNYFLTAAIIGLWLIPLTGEKHALAQPNTIITDREYLAFNRTHQAIYLNRLIPGSRNLVSACASELSVDEIAAYLSEWMRANPLSLNRPANLAFSQALTARCRQLASQYFLS